MMNVKEIETAITQLPVAEVDELVTWLADYHAQVWDRQIEDDLETGRLETLLAVVEREYEAGLAQPCDASNPPTLLAALSTAARRCASLG